MSNGTYSKNDILTAIRSAAEVLGKPPSRSEFASHSGITEYHVLKWFPIWNSAVAAAGLKPSTGNIKLDSDLGNRTFGPVSKARHSRR